MSAAHDDFTIEHIEDAPANVPTGPMLGRFRLPVQHLKMTMPSRAQIVMNGAGKGFGGGEATRDPAPT